MKTNNLIKFAASLMLCCMFFGCTPEEEKLGTIYGIVTVTGEPLKGIGVSLFVDDALLLKTVTYDDGHYEFSDLKPGEYTLKVETEGYNTFSTSVMVESGRQARADMQLTLVETHMDVVTYEVAVSGNAALLKGHYSTSYGSGSSHQPNEIGFYYSTSTPVSNGIKVKTSDGIGYYNSDFEISVPNLMPDTYYVQAYAKNSYGTAFGDTKTFVISGDPIVKTLDATNVNQHTATLNGEIVFAGNPAFTERGFVYSSSFTNPTIDDPETSTTKKIVSGTSTSFSANIDNLTSNVTYYVRAFATNAKGTSYGEQKTIINLNLPTFQYDGHSYWVAPDPGNKMSRRNAESYCANYGIYGTTGWKLPSLGELIQMYTERNSIGGFASEPYWSNSYDHWDVHGDYYWLLDFTNGASSIYDDRYSYRVRPIKQID